MTGRRGPVRFATYLGAALALVAWPGVGWSIELPVGNSQAWVAILEKDGNARLTILSNNGVDHERPLPAALTAPLGSLWKLFVYLYLVDRRFDVPAFECAGRRQEETFCCEPGESVGMQAALARSCGLFFEPSRLGIDAQEWDRYWRERGSVHTWLLDLPGLRPERTVPVAELLQVLHRTGPYPRMKAREALSEVLISGSARGKIRHLGSLLRAKTYTWNHPADPARFIGGFAGWLNDGAAVWAAAEGSGSEVIARWGRAMAPLLDRAIVNPSAGCVDVDFFSRYPIRQVTSLHGDVPASSGAMNGRYRVEFENGNRLELESGVELRLTRADGHPRISGRFTVNDYVARVLDREVDPREIEAAKAFAVVVRSYLLGNGERQGECFRITDSSATQRVSPNPPGEFARRISYWTDGLVLSARDVRYHRDSPGVNRLAWTQAVEMARNGKYFDQILQSAYPNARIEPLYGDGREECRRLETAEHWIDDRASLWHSKLTPMPGYERPGRIEVCSLAFGNPYSDPKLNRIHVRGLRSSEDRITLAHEYLHLAFQHHPSGSDERFVEEVAQALAAQDLYVNAAGVSDQIE